MYQAPAMCDTTDLGSSIKGKKYFKKIRKTDLNSNPDSTTY